MRFLAGICLLFLLTLVPGWLAIVLMIMHVFWFGGLEIVVITLFIDAYFGHAAAYPWYTLVGGGLLIAATWLRPRLMFYNT